MDLLLVRHALAGNKLKFARTGRPDRDRPITAAGAKKMKKVIGGLRKLDLSLSVIVTSPLKRAQQTAAIIKTSFPNAKWAERPELAPGKKWPPLFRFLNSVKTNGAVALVGHEPDLGKLASMLLAGKNRSFIEFKKAGCAFIHFDGQVKAAGGTLLWIVKPSFFKK